MLLLSLCLLIPQIDPIFNQYGVKFEDKIAFFGLGESKLFQYDGTRNFNLVNPNLYPGLVFEGACDRPLVIHPYIFVPVLDRLSGHQIASIDVLHIQGNSSNKLTSHFLYPGVSELRIEKYRNSVLCIINSIRDRVLIFFEVTLQSQTILKIVRHSKFGNIHLFLGKAVVLRQNAGVLFCYSVVYSEFPEKKAIIYNLNSDWLYEQSGYEYNTDVVPYGYPLTYVSQWGTGDWLYLQSKMDVIAAEHESEIREFVPYDNHPPLFPYQYHKLSSLHGFVGKCDGDFDGNGRDEAVITGYGENNRSLIIREYGPMMTYVQTIPLYGEYRWINDAIAGDFNVDSKVDLVLMYGINLNSPEFKFLRGTRQLFNASLSWD